MKLLFCTITTACFTCLLISTSIADILENRNRIEITNATVNGNTVTLTEDEIDEITKITAKNEKKMLDAKETAETASAEKKASDTVFGGFNTGAGLMGGFYIGGNKRVEKASVVNGVVRVDKENKTNIGVIAEVHRLWVSDDAKSQWGIGPFVGLVLSGDNDVINAASLGIMIGFRPKNKETSLNIGIGGVVTPSAQVLGDGINENEKLPDGETEIRYKEVTKYGIAIAVSFGF